jgi:hypothetical protein
MRTIKFEIGLCVVVEQPRLPAVRIMARSTIRPETTLVFIILFMALNTLEGCFFIYLRNMTLLARNHRVTSNQRKTGNVVLKKYLACPTFCVMTLITFLAHLPFMRIMELVAAIAISRQFFFDRATMTGPASHLFMSASEGKICFLVMIETCFSPCHC